ncbi:MAG: DegT/DnrJ/EryC1/StrS family aminotransferase [Promethearchaeota archaeon]
MSYKIPLFELNYGKEEEKAVLEVIRSKWISMGPKVQEIENEFSAYLKVKYAVALSSCTAALHLALKILGVQEGDEVVVPSLTFVATVNAVRHVNAKPIFADITSKLDFSIDPRDIAKKVTTKTKAIIVMHYAGFSCNMASIMKIAKRHRLFIIEDAAHSLGSEYEGKKLGTIGDIGCFSFFANKNITCAEGGLLVTNNYKYAKEAKLLRAHGMSTLSYERAMGQASGYDVLDLGFNYRLDDIRGALIQTQLKKLKQDLEKRREIRNMYIKELKRVKGLLIPYEYHKYPSANYIFPIILEDVNEEKRNLIRAILAEKGIQTSIHYPAVHNFAIYKKYSSYLAITEKVSKNEITLPFHSKLSEEHIEYITNNLKLVL